MGMKYALMISAAVMMAVGHGQPASAQSPTELVKQAVDARGGGDGLRASKTVVGKGAAKHWEPGQSNSVNGESRFLGDAKFTLSGDVASRTIRADWDRDMKYPAVEKLKYSEIVTPTYGAVIDDKGEAKPMSGIRLASLQRELIRGAPTLLLRALDTPQSLSPTENQDLSPQPLPTC